ncbi:Predicted amidohydrolase [Bhargavaea ginsengi]|uniref:Predicted amidohydrolase n=1 Tax=Bhargavaea ginsengi TaxID=426757 RepID=A0A1H6UD67_9BACL|nr:nitrilase family protein [Bhargavaea ginsengi]SEI90353.1 Predicted amidohydrolase [Bhargavaea ginsengi]
MTTKSQTKVACCQFDPKVGKKQENINRSIELIKEASKNGAQLVVLPELCNSGYVFNSKKEAFDLSEPVVSEKGETIKAWEACAKENDVYIAAGINERDGEILYNSAVLIGPNGLIGSYRKVHLWDDEKNFFVPGESGVPVFDTPIGKVALLICYDVWFPEIFRMCSLNGAEIVAVCTNWVPLPDYRQGDTPVVVHICMASAHTNGVFIVAANRVGVERERRFLGNSLIIRPTGAIESGPASFDKEEIITATLNLEEVESARKLSKQNHILGDRREEVYSLDESKILN